MTPNKKQGGHWSDTDLNYHERLFSNYRLLCFLYSLEFLSVCKFLGATADKGNCFEKKTKLFLNMVWGVYEIFQYIDAH